MDGRRFGLVTSDATSEYESQQLKQAKAGSSAIVVPDEERYPFLKLPNKPFIRVDILPFLTETSAGLQPLTRYNYYVHRGLGETFQSFICPSKQYGKPCPICEHARTIPFGDPSFKDFRPKQRQLYAVYWLDAPEEVQDKIHILDISEFGFGRILDERIRTRDMADENERRWNEYADPCEGFTLKLNLCDRQLNGSTYRAVASIDIKPRQRQYTEAIYDEVPDLSKCLVNLDYDELKARFEATQETKEKQEASGSGYDPTAGYNPIVDVGSDSAGDMHVSNTHEEVSPTIRQGVVDWANGSSDGVGGIGGVTYSGGSVSLSEGEF